MLTEALAGLVFLPLLAACAVAVLPPRWRGGAVLLGLLPLPVLLWPITAEVWREGLLLLSVAGFERPLGIVWRVDALALVLLWMNAVIGLVVGLHAAHDFPAAGPRGGRFWSLWLLLLCAMNALLLSADLFNVFVTLELVTLAAIGLLVIEGKPAALRAAMRYLLLALLGSLLYLLGVALVYGQAGTLDLYQAGELLGAELLPVTALVLMTVGLLVKAAIFPLHGWLPAAHGNAPGPVSAILSAMVVKVSVYLIWRLWFWFADGWSVDWALPLLGALGAGAILYGSALALLQARLKMMVAYSTVAQLGYLMLLFPLFGAAGFTGASYHLLSHGLAKSAMFLAAANIFRSMGSDRLEILAGTDRRLPMDVFTLAIAGVSILGLPPSGGFAAKWLMLQAAWTQGSWLWLTVILAGGLLAAAYLFRALAALCARPVGATDPIAGTARPSPLASLVGLALALAAIVAGFVPAPVLEFLGRGLPPGAGP
jgi:multicomponent Na+:H+ antiporter subunit D